MSDGEVGGSSSLEPYLYRGARAVVMLHDAELRRCVTVWRRVKDVTIVLPVATDPDYASLETLLAHILGAARGYLLWICRQLDLPDPEIRPVPDVSVLEREAEDYLGHLLERWRLPLVGVPEARFEPEVYVSNWGTPYAVEAMLEHALVHPMRHTFQLEELIAAQRYSK